MREQLRNVSIKSVKRLRRLPLLVVIVTTTVLAIAAGTAVSKQMVNVKESKHPERSAALTNSANNNYLRWKVADREVQVDSQTAQIRPLTPQEAQKLADGIKTMVNQSTDGLVSVKHSDGSVSVDLQDRFRHVMVVKKNDDGTLSQSCIDNPQSAAAFFDLDPQLFQDQTQTGPASKSQSGSAKQVNSSQQVKSEDH